MNPLSPVTLGVVIIGRNEGKRLVTCLEAVQRETDAPIVYVDSGSTDGSVERARALGVQAVALSADRPFTAARGRNTGFETLRRQHAQLSHVLFLDGDTELIPGFLAQATARLQHDTALAAVCGRRRERHPNASIYNQLCDLEWNTEVSDDAPAFGGDVLVRVTAVAAAGGYDETLIAGEDPDLSVRLRKAGHRIARIGVDMTWHDAAMSTLSQWWKRSQRAGHAYAEGAERHRDIGFWRKEVRSNWAWGAVLPLLGTSTLLPTLGLSASVMGAGFATLMLKIERDAKRRGLSPEEARAYAKYTALAKLPMALGQADYWRHRLQNKKRGLIEYK